MSEPTKEELLDFMRKHGPEKVDSITDTESVIRHFRCTSKVYKEQRDQYKTENERLESELAAALNGELSTYDELQEYVLELQSDLTEYHKECEKLISVADEAMDIAESENSKVLRLERENEKQLKLLKDFSKFIDHKLYVSPANDAYKHYRYELDKLGIK